MVFLRLLFYLAVLILILVLAYYTTRFVGNGVSRRQRSGNMEILDRITVGRDSYLIVAKVQDKILLLGVSPAGIEKLQELDSYEKNGPAGTTSDFAALLTDRMKLRDVISKDKGETEHDKET